jgi:membrane protease YdiL (CAAX protease family)
MDLVFLKSKSFFIWLLSVIVLLPIRDSAADNSVPGLNVSTTSSASNQEHRRVEAKIVFADSHRAKRAHPDLVSLDIYHQSSAPHLTVYMPYNLEAEYLAMPDEQGRLRWLAERFQKQMEAGDLKSATAYGVMMLYGFGVEQNLPAALAIFRKSVERGEYREPRFYAELRIFDSDQPEGSREAAALLLPMLEGGDCWSVWPGNVATKILQKSALPEDVALADKLKLALEAAIFVGLASKSKDEGHQKYLSKAARYVGMQLMDKEREKSFWSMGLLPLDQGKLDRAAKLFQSSLDIEPENILSHYLLCTALRLQGTKPEEIYERTTRAISLSQKKQDNQDQRDQQDKKNEAAALQILKLYQWEAALYTNKLGEPLGEQSFHSESMMVRIRGLWLVALAGGWIFLFAVLAFWTHRFAKKPVGIVTTSVWLIASVTPSLFLFGSPLAVFVVVPIALGLILMSLPGSRAALGYLDAPRRENLARARLWMGILGICAGLFFLTCIFDEIYLWAFRQVLGRDASYWVAGLLMQYHKLHGVWGLVGSIALIGVLVGFIEEIAFRGFLFDWVRRFAPVWLAVILTSVAFGLMHGWDAAIPTGLMGVMFAWLRLRYESLWPSIVLHALNNSIFNCILYFKPELLGFS